MYLFIYIILISSLCFIIGFIIGKKFGWHIRDNIERVIQLKKSEEEFYNLQQEWNKFYTELKKIESKKSSPNSPTSTLEEQLKEAVENEDFEIAAKIRDKLNKNQK